jgi:hypothetical protein
MLQLKEWQCRKVVDGADNIAPQISVTKYRVSFTEARQRGVEAVRLYISIQHISVYYPSVR